MRTFHCRGWGMKNFFTIIIVVIAVVCAGAQARAAPPNPVQSIFTYQGSMFVDNEPFDGTGLFKLVIVNESGQSLWSNDGTSVDGSEPAGDVAVAIQSGIFQVLLGDVAIPGMLQIDPAIFATDEMLFLKVWFDDGANGFAEMKPSIQLTASTSSMNAHFLRGYSPDDFFLNSGQITSSQIAPGAVQQTNIAGGAVGTTQIIDNSVTGDKITAFTNNNTQFTVGRGQNENIVIFADTAAATNPGLRFDSTTGKWQFSNNGTTWSDIGSGGGGGVNPGLINQIAYYAAAGSTVSGLATANNGVLATSGAGVPSIATTLPTTVQGNITQVGIIGTGVWQGTAIADAYVADNLTINAGTIDNSIIGGTTAANATVRDLVAELDAVIEGGDLTIGLGTTAYAGRVILHDADAGDSFTTTIQSNANVGASFSLILPADVGSSGQVLSTDGNSPNAQLSWVNAGTGDFKADGTVPMTGNLNVGDNNIINVGDIALDSISADNGTSFAINDNWTNAGNTVADLGTVTTADINGGTIDGVTMGQATAGLGTFTTLDATNIEATGTFKLGTTNQGDVLYDNGTSIVRLPPGTSGQFLQTQGAGANPQWASPAGGGDVTGPAGATDNAVARYDGATGKLIQNSGVLVDDSNNMSGIAALSISSMGQNWTNAGRTIADLGSVTTADINGGTIDGVTINSSPIGGTTPAAGAFTALNVGTTNQGDILYDNGTSFVRLPPGTSGQVLTTQGAGANPQWSSAGANYWSKTLTNLSPATPGDDLLLNTNETLTIGGGTAITRHLSATASIDIASIAARSCTNTALTVTGAAAGNTVVCSPTPVASGIETLNLSWNCYVSAANTVQVRACNPTTGALDPATQTWRADVWQH